MYKNILYPTDGSEAAETVIKHVKDLASTYEARVHIIYVVAPDSGDSSMVLKKDEQGNWKTGMFKRQSEPISTSGMAKGSVDVNEVLRQEGESYIGAVADELNEAGCKVKTACVKGTPHKEILNYGENNDIDLIAMGTHGRSGVERQFIGSVTEKVVRGSEIPVLTIRHND